MKQLLFVPMACAALILGHSVSHAGAGLDEREAVVDRVAELLETRYVDAKKGRDVARQIRRDFKSLKWQKISGDEEFAQAVTTRLRELSSDGHLSLDYSAKALAPDADAAEEAFGADEFEKWYGAGVNHGFQEVRRLEGNVGYLNLTVFAPPAMGADLAVAAMSLLAQSDALIIDLRRNGGGDGAMGSLLAGYLLDGAKEMSGKYDRPSDKLTRAFSAGWVPGRRFGPDKPVYLLISKRTFSAAEAFTYDLQALKRVVVVGEPSGGGAHPFEYRRAGTHFVLSLPEGRSVNPIAGKDWEGVGVQPDVAVPEAQAMEKALELARQWVKPE
ncbi:MAG TPA: S41 family peptidase [Steroidobacteraceae bacterium]|nr:S41 family peptidase [Steroidobacteraceae bacterium]